MKINDEILMDYADGILNEEEERLVIDAIKNDPKLLKKVEEFKESTKLLKMVHALDIIETPDPSIQKQKSNNKKINSWFSFPNIEIPKFSPIAYSAVGGCLLLSFVGGTQLSNILGVYQMQNGVLLESYQVRSIGGWAEQKWFLSNNIAVRIDVDQKQVSPNDTININEKITIEYQVFKEVDIKLKLLKKNDNNENYILVKDFYSKKSVLLKNIEKIQNLRITNAGDYKFVFEIINKDSINNIKEISFPIKVSNR